MRFHRLILNVFFSVAVISVLSTNAHATASWDGGGNGVSWSDPKNWSSDALPGGGDDVIIAAFDANGHETNVVYSSGITTITSLTCDGTFNLSGGALTVNSLTSDGAFTFSGGTLSISGAVTGAGTVRLNGTGVSLDIAGHYSVANTTISAGILNINADNSISNLTINGGTLGGTAALIVTGSGTWSGGNMTGTGSTVIASGATLTISPGGPNKTLSGRTLTNQGTVNVMASITASSSAVIDNQSGGVFDFQADQTIMGASATFNNAGTLKKTAGTGTANFSSSIVFNNAGEVIIETGTLSLPTNGTSTGAFTVASGATLLLDEGGTHNFNAGSSVTGAGTVLLNGTFANLNIAGTYSVANTTIAVGRLNINAANAISNLTLSGGILGGTAALTVTGNGTWSSGAMIDSGSTVIASGAMLTLSTSGTKTLSARTLTNQGTVNVTGTGGVSVASSAVIDNQSGAVFDFQADQTITGGGTFNNAGILQKTAGSGTSNFASGIVINSTGTMSIETGTLSLPINGTYTGAISIASGATLRCDELGGTNALNSGASVTGAGTVAVTNGTLNINAANAISNLTQSGGTVGGTAELTVTGSGTWSGGIMSGTGSTVIASGATLTISNGSTKTLIGRTLTNQGTVNATEGFTASSSAVIDNQSGGVVDFQADQTITGVGTFTNAGILKKTAGSGTVNFASGIVINSTGTMSIETGTLSLPTNGTYTGAITIASGATLRCDKFGGTNALNSGASVTGAGTVAVTNGTLNINAANAISNLTLSGGTVGGTAALTVTGSGTWSGGIMSGTGSTVIASGATLTISNGSTKTLIGRTLTNQGTVNAMEGFTASSSAVIDNQSGGVVDFQADQTITGVGTFTNAGILKKTAGSGTSQVAATIPVNNTGTILVQTGTLYVSSLSNFSGSTLTGGTYNISGTLKFTSANIVTNAATIILNGAGSQIVDGAGANALANLATNTSAGSLTVQSGRTFTTAGAFSNAGAVAIGSGSTFTVGGSNNYTQTGGTTTLNSGTLATTGTVNIQGGVFSGNGMISADVTNAGQVSPGSSPGALSIIGNYTQSPAGALNAEIGGLTSGTEFDQLTISGSATLNGTLNVILINGFVPSSGNSFPVITFGSRSGSFSAINGLAIGNVQGFMASYNDGNLTFTATEPVIQLTTSTVNVGNVEMGSSGTGIFVITNPGNATLSISGISVSGVDAAQFTASPTSFNVAAGASQTVTVTFSPTSAGAKAAALTITHNAGGNPATVFLSGTGAVPHNHPPVAHDGSLSTDEDIPGNGTLSAGDEDGDALAYSVVTDPTQGTVSITDASTGAYTYTPNANVNGSDSFTFQVSDGALLSNMATVSVTVTPVNDDPVASAGSLGTNEDTPTTGTLNASDVEGDALTYTLSSNGSKGTVVLESASTGTFTYTPTADANGSDSFTYTISDGQGGTAVGTMEVTIAPVNDAPVASAGSLDTSEDTPATGTLNASDVEGEALSYSITSNGSKGAAVITDASTGTFTYTPNADANGSDSFTFAVSDGSLESNVGTVSVTIAPVNDAPVAVDEAVTTNEDTPVSGTLSASDVDGEVLTYSVVSAGSQGVVSIAEGAFIYTPNANANGTDSFNYRASDGSGGSATATVSVTIAAVNDDPVAADDMAETDEDTATDIAVKGNDADADGDVLSVATVTQGSKGSVVINGDGTVRYTPNANFNGADGFTYTISDGKGRTATASVIVTVVPVNDLPLAVNDAATTDEDTALEIEVTANDQDPDGDALMVTSVSQGGHGSVGLNGDGAVRYVPNANFNGSDSFSYTLSDGQGGTATGTVRVTVASVSDPPLAMNDAAETSEDAPVDIGVLTNDADVDGDGLSVVAVSQGVAGSVGINGDGTVRYMPGANFNGSDSFTYTISGGQGGIATAVVSVTIAPGNDAPVAGDDAATTNEDTATDIAVKANDGDVDGDGLTVTGVSQGAVGTVAINADGTVRYTPGANVNGPDSFTYTLSDGQGGEATATVRVTIAPVNDAPVANAGPDQSAECTSFSGAVVSLEGAGSSDVEGNLLNYRWFEGNNQIATGVNPAVSLSKGSHTLTLVVNDGTVNSVPDPVVILVQDTTSPRIAAPADLTVECSGSSGQVVALGNAVVSDAGDGAPMVSNDAPALFRQGVTTVTWTATDHSGNTAQAIQKVTVQDQRPPTVTAQLVAVWGTRHEDDDDISGEGGMYRVQVRAVDTCDGQPVITAYITQPLAPATSVVVSYQKEKKNKLRIKVEGGQTQVQLEGPSETALRALWTQAMALGGFNVVDNQVVRLSAKEEGHPEAEYQFDKQLILVTGKAVNLKLVTFARDAAGNQSAKVEAIPPRRRLAKSAGEALTQGMEIVTQHFSLQGNYPNPFNPSTILRYSLDDLQEVRLTIYNAMGQRVRVLVDQAQGPGDYQVEWSGSDGAGQQVGAGIYFYQLQAGTQQAVGRMLLLK